jgi:IS30 family transposase
VIFTSICVIEEKSINTKAKVARCGGMIINRVDINLKPKIVDRKTKFTKLITVKDGAAVSVTSAVISSLLSLPMTHRTITFDNGKEFSFHEEVAMQTGAKTYFATPYHSWERGLNEHTNGLVASVSI